MIIVLLGNPGKKYEDTKHNAAWIISLAWSLEWKENKYAESIEAEYDAMTFVKPETFMNESGRAVLWYLKKREEKPENLVVVYDDVDLPVGTVRVSFNRGSGGHNGIKSIEQVLGTPAFTRIRIGVARKNEEGNALLPESRRDFVLASFSQDNKKEIESLSGKVMKIIETIQRDGVEKAMNEFN